ncbi:lysylphosphatidylglycerol synthase transmembrane domain-containing protein [Bdellovibrio reynosensis]|uniref:Flippase-like domain-containing protein n=1 Tax=Bdellovibrio reynosensis TaxID=2835041 RepID=A0ABY4CC06_9BACT|nr:lysylphosphatidylglycerol synthase transmembrane domain-containing protein [Bdellovibrio reynosensis]UOF01241.1 flippase-like domain-containing protein [Bdellovibrio reynosensis]
MVKHSKKLLVQSLKLLVSAGIIFWLIQSGKLNFAALKNLLAPGPACLALILVFLNLYFASERWRILIRSQGLPAYSWPVYKLSLIGAFFNFAMPGGVGGDVIKAYYFTRENPGSKVVAVTSVLMDRVLGLFAMLLMALLVMIYDIKHILNIPVLLTLFYIIAGLSFGFLIALSLIFSQKIYANGMLTKIINKLPLSHKFSKLYESMHLYGRDGKRFAQVIFLSFFGQLCSIMFLYLAGTMAGFSAVPLKTYFLVAPLGFMATAIPISPAGIGVGQAAFYFLFNLYTGTESELGPTVITAFQVGIFLVSLLGAFFYLRRKDKIEPAKIEEAG